MRASTVIALSLAILGVAAVPQEECEAQTILDTCLKTYKPRFDGCSGNNYECLCTEAQNMLTCYNNCPNSEGKSGVSSQVTSFCGAFSATKSTASATGSSTETSAGTGASATSGSGSSDSASTTTGGTASASASADAGNAGMAITPAKTFGALAGVLAVAGAFL